jgi:hypothetical protein
MKKTVFKLSLIAAAVLSTGLAAAATPDEIIDNAFYPYKKGFPAHAFVKPGVVINKSNVDSAKDVLDPAMYQIIKNGDYEITVGPPTSFDLHKNYVDQTRAGIGKVKLGEKNGQIIGYVAGRAFPEEPDLKDPRAGEKLAWNYKYGINWGDAASIEPFYWKYRKVETGKIETVNKFGFHFLNYKHRVVLPPVPEITPNPSNLFRSIYMKVFEPIDIKDTQLLIQRYDDDLKQDDANLYLGFQRRVRRLATGQITDSFLGSDLMIEDFEGYNGRVTDMKWTYKGTTTILMAYYNHNDQKTLSTEFKEKDGYQYVEFGGKGGCYPLVTWQLRKVYILESVPTDAAHPISKRIQYMDTQAATLSRSLIYDRKGELWKNFIIGKSHPDHHLPINKGTGISIDDAFSMVDLQSKHCTTGQFRGMVSQEQNPPSLFTVQNMRGAN